MTRTAVIIILCALYLAAVWARIIRRRTLSHGATTVLLSLRVVLLALLLLAFLEPRFSFTRLEPPRGDIPVLFDVSRSMRLFGPDTTAAVYLRSLAELVERRPSPARRAEPFSFGDSLRTGLAPAPNDRKSFLPRPSSDPHLLRAPTILIVSDGNWSNPSLPHDAFRDKDCWYAMLPPIAPRPYLDIAVVSLRQTVPADSQSSVSVEISAYRPEAGRVTLTCRRGETLILRKSVAADSGFTRDSMALALPPSAAGRIMYSVDVYDSATALSSSVPFVQTVVPGSFRACMYSAQPCLDRRFLSLALDNAGNWKRTACDDNGRPAEAYFFLDWDQAADRIVSSLPPRTVLVFLGCLPCSSAVASAVSTFTVLRHDPGLAQIAPQSLPPPEFVVRCGRDALRERTVYVHAAVGPAAGRKQGMDTLSVVFETAFRRHSALAAPVRGLWRWDFWPLGLGRGTPEFTFTSGLLSLVKELAVIRSADAYVALPLRPEILEGDSATFRLILPSRIASAARASARMVVVNARTDTVADTTLTVVPEWDLSSIVSLPPLPAGDYTYTTVLEAQAARSQFAGALRVRADDSEMRVRGQNTLLLNQIGRPFDIRNPDHRRELLAALENEPTRGATVQTFRITQSWWLLIALFAVLAAEWVLRRKLDLD